MGLFSFPSSKKVEISRLGPLGPPPTNRELRRRQLMSEVDNWDLGDEDEDKAIAKAHAQLLVDLLKEQFGLTNE